MNKHTRETIKLYDQAGYCVIDVESGIQGSKYLKKDFLGFGDLLALHSNAAIIIQSTDYTNHSKRLKKVLSSPFAYLWLLSSEISHHIHVVSWNFTNGRDLRTDYVTMDQFGDLVRDEALYLINRPNSI